MNDKIKICGAAFALYFCAAFFSGCSGAPTPSQNIPGKADDKAQILKIIAETPYDEIAPGESISPFLSKDKNALPSGIASVVRGAIQITRNITSVSFNETNAAVEAAFSISGSLSFKDSQGNVVDEKPITVQTTGSYALSKDSAGAWKLMENAVDGLLFLNSDIVVSGFSLSPAFPGAGDNVTFTIKLSSLSTASPEFSCNIYFKSLNLKIPLADNGTSGDATAGDGTFTARIAFPSSLSHGRYVLAMDIIEKTGSFDITKSSVGNLIKGYNGIFATQGIILGDVQKLSISAKQDTSAIQIGSLTPFTAKAEFSSGILDVTRLVSWNSSNSSAGALNPVGYFLALSPGTTTVTAVAGGFTSNAIGVTVK